MKFWIIVLGIYLLCNISFAQISPHIDYNDIKANPPEHGWKWGRYFWGSFDLENLPAPLKPTKVNFTLEAVHGDEPGKEGEIWPVRLFYEKSLVRIVGDTIFHWPGPHKAGDIYSNSFEFMPIKSGLCGISLEIPGTRENISLYWCLDEDGNLVYLGRDNGARFNCTNIRVLFFTKDSVYARCFGSYSDAHYPRTLFAYGFTVTPTPQIGDTSIIHYRLTAIEDILDNIDVHLEGMSVDFPFVSTKPQLPIMKGQIVDLFIKFVPKAVNDVHLVRLSLTESPQLDKASTRFQDIILAFVFNNDKSLRYVTNATADFRGADKLPTKFRERDFRNDHKVVILNYGN